ncbi:uncharacterized protein LOC130917077 [Corythoichthys intestinalis]|uniref:uncharacterized protein LOC130917077 n=1 Tax=Corythoichthys intestinalis TaxID=161448 RepID=UPI0025A636E9|nr:uncharacterized protein LOC130917077 [Corythoichthys intestinalis]
MEEKWDEIHNLLFTGSYPEGYDRSQRQNLRRYASKFHLKDGELFFGSRRGIKSREETRRLFEEFHASPIGGHTGIRKTRSAITSRYYWYGMSVDIDKWVIDAYLQCLIVEHKIKFAAEDIWLCPVNLSSHWILVIINIPMRTMEVVDPIGNEDSYKRKIIRNWRNFLKKMGRLEDSWHLKTLEHHKQQDSSSCGVLVLEFAKNYIFFGEITGVLTTDEAIAQARQQIACTLLDHRGNAEDYCVLCCMIESDGESNVIEMVQCHRCNRWAHFECAQYFPQDGKNNSEYCCTKCK